MITGTAEMVSGHGEAKTQAQETRFAALSLVAGFPNNNPETSALFGLNRVQSDMRHFHVVFGLGDSTTRGGDAV
jgi:hypothetical protein